MGILLLIVGVMVVLLVGERRGLCVIDIGLGYLM